MNLPPSPKCYGCNSPPHNDPIRGIREWQNYFADVDDELTRELARINQVRASHGFSPILKADLPPIQLKIYGG